jgi:hypothetical protein
MDVNGTLVSALCGEGSEDEFSRTRESGVKALLSIQPQIVVACERAFLQAIQQENK